MFDDGKELNFSTLYSYLASLCRLSNNNLLINSLLKKDMIKVVGVKQMTKNYARTFVPTMTKDAYAIKQISDRPNFADSDIPTLFSELIEKTESSEIFDKLEALLKKRREELGK